MEQELEVAQAAMAFVGDGTAAINSYTVSDIFFNAKLTTLPNDIDDLLIQSTGGIVNLPAISYKAEAKTISAASSAFKLERRVATLWIQMPFTQRFKCPKTCIKALN